MAVYSHTLNTLIAAVRTAINEPSGQQFFQDGEIGNWINEAQLEICRYTECIQKSEEPTVDGTADYTLPSDFFKARKIQYRAAGQNRLLEWIEPDNYLSLRTVSSSDIPRNYTIIDNSLYLYPTPTSSSDTYFHLYVAMPEKLVDGGDVPFNGLVRLYPYHRLIVDLAVKLAFAKKEGAAPDMLIGEFTPRMELMKRSLSNYKKPGGGKVKRAYRGASKPAYPVLPSNY